MKYEIIPQEDTVMVKISENGTTEMLNMQEEPDEACILVENSRKDVLGEINLEKLLSNLDNCVDLLQITFNAVDGFTVQSEVQELSNRFIDAMTKSNTVALDFKLATQSVLEAYLNAYGCLFYGDVATAIDLIADSKNVASRMVKKADELVKTFDGLTDYTNKVLKKVMDERAADEQKRTETKALITELEGSIEAMEQLKENLQKDIAQFEADYKKLQEREMAQEKRAYNMQLASMIIGAVGSLFGVAGANQSGKEERDQAEKQTDSEKKAPSAQEQAEKNYTDNVAKQEQKKSAIEKADKRIEEIDKVLDGELYRGGKNHESADSSNPDTEKTDAELRTEKENEVKKKEKLNREWNELKGQEKTLSDTLTGFGVAMDKVSEETHNAAEAMQKQADSLAERMDAISVKREALKEKERENLAQLAKYTAKMQNMVMDENSLESAIQCLVIAVGCLRRVLAYLHEMKLFWENVETYCENLAADNNISKLIERQKDADEEKRAAYFKTILFVRGYAGMLAKWKALYLIFSEYLVALAKVSKRMSATLEQSLSADRKEQWKLATKMAGELKEKLDIEIESTQ